MARFFSSLLSCRMLAAAALFILVMVPPYLSNEMAQAQNEEAQMASIAPPPPTTKISTPVDQKPQIKFKSDLSNADAELYRSIFTLQKSGSFNEADKLIAKIKDRILIGHVLYQRYLHPDYPSAYPELKEWMAKYYDLPGANRIYRLAVARAPAEGDSGLKMAAPREATIGFLEASADFREAYVSKIERSVAAKKEAANTRQRIIADVFAGKPDAAYAKLQSGKQYFDQVEYDILQSRIASGYLYLGKLDRARALSEASAARAGVNVPLASWIAGLTAWHVEQYAKAADYFETAARSPYATGWTLSAASYWASRAHMRAGSVEQVSEWLNRATRHPRTFYGLIAMTALGREYPFNWEMPEWDRNAEKTLLSDPAGQRAIALLTVGEYDQAQEELLSLNPLDDDKVQRALLAAIEAGQLPRLGLRLGGLVKNEDTHLYHAALYPLASWQPGEDRTIDRALLLAIARQESRYNPLAANPSGATGLMQLIPSTARYAIGDEKYEAAGGDAALLDPEFNLMVGQTYIDYLLRQSSISSNLFGLMISYNAGPGNYSRWKKRLAHINDPLLFIESLPSGETRAFVERTMSNYWMYRLRFGQIPHSLNAVAEGRWPLYISQESWREK